MGPSLEGGRADFLGYELPMLAGLILCVFCQKFKNLSLRYLAIYGVGTLFAYSYVKYKTPWCIISFGWPFLFIFGAAVLLVRPKHLLIALSDHRRRFVHFAGLVHLAKLLPLQLARGALRLRPDL